MVGIFGAWGRGKTYFWNQVKQQIEKRQDQNAGHKEKHVAADVYYDIVEFNAWKYQDTPALWAYLYKTIYNKANCRARCKTTLHLLWQQQSYLVIAAVLGIIVLWALCSYLHISLWYILGVGTLAGVIDILHHFIELFTWKQKFDDATNYTNILGLQNEIESKLSCLCSKWIRDKDTTRHKIILYVDDIDRCDEEKMVSILEALRTLLENSTINERVIVTCSIDRDRIITSMEKKYASSPDSTRDIVSEQLDKLFIFSIGLPHLDIAQQKRFVQRLVDDTTKDEDDLPFSTSRVYHSMIATIQPDEILTTYIIAQWLQEFIGSSHHRLTPRKIRIIYYRLLFASSLLAASNQQVYMSHDLAQRFFQYSFYPNSSIDINECFSDIIEIVIPYPIITINIGKVQD